jgi:hypothetical protein
MKPAQIKNAFACIAEEAGKNDKLNQAVSMRISAKRTLLPLTELKMLLLHFATVILLAAAVYFAAGLVQIEVTESLASIDVSTDPERIGVPFSQAITVNPTLIIVWLIRGITRGFILLAALTFILTAAAMPVRRHEEITGGPPCVA